VKELSGAKEEGKRRGGSENVKVGEREAIKGKVKKGK
jgi:hypothetical protein